MAQNTKKIFASSLEDRIAFRINEQAHPENTEGSKGIEAWGFFLEVGRRVLKKWVHDDCRPSSVGLKANRIEKKNADVFVKKWN